MIHRVRIQNFKSMVDVAVDLSPVTVLVGKSGTGKSNFVHSLRFLRDLLASRQGARSAQSDWAHLRPATKPSGPTRFEVEFSIDGIEDVFRYELSIASQGPQVPPVEERLALGGTSLFHQRLKDPKNALGGAQWIVEPAIVSLPDPGAIAIGRIASISEVVIAFTALTAGLGCYVFSDKVLCGASQGHAVTGLQGHAETGLNDDAGNYLGALREIVRNLQDLSVRKNIVAALQRVNPSVSSVELNDVQQPSHVVVGHRFNGKTLPLQLSQESDGFRRFYAHLLALYQRPPRQTLIFEHPEDGIHPGVLSLLAEEFKAAPEAGRGQVILTTHSPALLDHFEVGQIRVVELDEFATRIGLLSREQKEALQERLLDAGELLTVDPARIESETTDA